MTLGLHRNEFGYMKVRFQTAYIFAIDFNDIMKHWSGFGFIFESACCDFGVTSGLLWVYESCSDVTLVRLQKSVMFYICF